MIFQGPRLSSDIRSARTLLDSPPMITVMWHKPISWLRDTWTRWVLLTQSEMRMGMLYKSEISRGISLRLFHLNVKEVMLLCHWRLKIYWEPLQAPRVLECLPKSMSEKTFALSIKQVILKALKEVLLRRERPLTDIPAHLTHSINSLDTPSLLTHQVPSVRVKLTSVVQDPSLLAPLQAQSMRQQAWKLLSANQLFWKQSPRRVKTLKWINYTRQAAAQQPPQQQLFSQRRPWSSMKLPPRAKSTSKVSVPAARPPQVCRSLTASLPKHDDLCEATTTNLTFVKTNRFKYSLYNNLEMHLFYN